MLFHSNASTNHRQRREIAVSSHSVRALARFYSVSPGTVHRWRNRADPNDRSSRPANLRRAFGPGLEAAALALRRSGLTLDQCLDALAAEFGHVSRATLHRFFVRQGLGNRRDQNPRQCGVFKVYEPGFLHVDCMYLPPLEGRRYLFVAIDRATRLAFVKVTSDKTMKTAHAFLRQALDFFPFKVHRVLTDNGNEFTNRFWKRRPSGARNTHPFTLECTQRGIHHRLTKPFTPRTNGMVERFNRIVKEATVNANRYETLNQMHEHILNWAAFYNSWRPHGGIQRRTPLREALRWYNEKPELFTRKPCEKDLGAFSTY